MRSYEGKEPKVDNRNCPLKENGQCINPECPITGDIHDTTTCIHKKGTQYIKHYGRG